MNGRKVHHAVALSVVLVLACANSGLCLPPVYPNTPAGKRAEEIVDLMNSGDEAAAEAYIDAHYAPAFKSAFPMARHLSVFTMTRGLFGNLVLRGIAESSEVKIEAILESSKLGVFLHLALEVEAEDPHRITRMGIVQGAPPEELDEEAAEDPAESDAEVPFSNFLELDSYLNIQTSRDLFSGVVLVARDGQALFHKAYGLASKNFKVPNRPDTKFNIGSLNKLFTSIAVSQLVEKGKLGFDDPIGVYLDGFSREASEKVTIRHLLQMRSGWGDYWGSETYLASKDRLRSVSDYIEFLRLMPLEFEPGTQQIHSNTSFQVLGAIIEKVSGEDYYSYIRDHVYTPAGMKDTDSYDKDGPVENLAVGYTNLNPSDSEKEGFRWSNIFMMPPRGTPAGGGYSTAEDLLKLDIALREHVLLDERHTNYLFRRYEGSLDEGFRPQRPVLLAGGAPGINALLGIDLKQGHTIIVLSNYDMPVAIELGQLIVRMLVHD